MIRSAKPKAWKVSTLRAWMPSAWPMARRPGRRSMIRVVMFGSYKAPREATWLSGLVLLGLILAFALTGYLLPWDQLAVWAITVGSNMARATPLLGHEGPGAQLLEFGGIKMITNASDALGEKGGRISPAALSS